MSQEALGRPGQGTSIPRDRLAAADVGPVVYLNFAQDSAAGEELRLVPQVPVPAGLYALTPVAGAPPVVEVVMAGGAAGGPAPAPGGPVPATAAPSSHRHEAPRR